MKHTFLAGLLLVALGGCTKRMPYDPTSFMPKEEQVKILDKVVRYAAKLPPTATEATKFLRQFDDYYHRTAADYQFLYLSPEPNEEGYYFLISRPARSITPMFEGIAGRLTLNAADSLSEYNEIFRMWKMPDKEVKERGLMLFEHMIQGKDLSIYYAKFAGDKYIEFPDERFTFDQQARIWRDRIQDSLSRGR